MNRRNFLSLAMAAAGTVAWPLELLAKKKTSLKKIKLVVIGGGIGGSTVIHSLLEAGAPFEITLIEPNRKISTGPMSNLVAAGFRDLSSITFDHAIFMKKGVSLVHDQVTAVDLVKKTVRTSARNFAYDYLVLTPGIDFYWGSIQGFGENIASEFPNGWRPGPETSLIFEKLKALKPGGVVAMTSPPNPYRCPPGPYERASLLAAYLKKANPKAKILILDSKDSFPKQPLFEEAWKKHYPGMIEWVSKTKGGEIVELDKSNGALISSGKEKYKADFIQIIPAQKAKALAGFEFERVPWYPIVTERFVSKQSDSVFVFGDSAALGETAKSAFSASAQGKFVAMSLLSIARDEGPLSTRTMINVCYSKITPDLAISVNHHLEATKDGWKMKKDSTGYTALGQPDATYRKESEAADLWYETFTKQVFG
jgi:sulfide dehydrogenase [flavocytochrome c] flavoprotein subunit